jgi:hypothetical protein
VCAVAYPGPAVFPVASSEGKKFDTNCGDRSTNPTSPSHGQPQVRVPRRARDGSGRCNFFDFIFGRQGVRAFWDWSVAFLSQQHPTMSLTRSLTALAAMALLLFSVSIAEEQNLQCAFSHPRASACFQTQAHKHTSSTVNFLGKIVACIRSSERPCKSVFVCISGTHASPMHMQLCSCCFEGCIYAPCIRMARGFCLISCCL